MICPRRPKWTNYEYFPLTSWATAEAEAHCIWARRDHLGPAGGWPSQSPLGLQPADPFPVPGFLRTAIYYAGLLHHSVAPHPPRRTAWPRLAAGRNMSKLERAAFFHLHKTLGTQWDIYRCICTQRPRYFEKVFCVTNKPVLWKKSEVNWT